VGKVLDELKSRGRMAVYAYLLDTKLIELGSNQVGIVFKNNGCKMLVEKSENLEVIEECLRECLGKRSGLNVLTKRTLLIQEK